jgi:hypothetical protein
MSTTVLLWNYKPFWLLLSYSLAVAFTLLAAIEGLLAFKRNGYAADTNFSTILVTTRNVGLDRIAEGHCLGQSPVGKEFERNKLRFGDVGVADTSGGNRTRHAAFGTPDEVHDIHFRAKYI